MTTCASCAMKPISSRPSLRYSRGGMRFSSSRPRSRLRISVFFRMSELAEKSAALQCPVSVMVVTMALLASLTNSKRPARARMYLDGVVAPLPLNLMPAPLAPESVTATEAAWPEVLTDRTAPTDTAPVNAAPDSRGSVDEGELRQVRRHDRHLDGGHAGAHVPEHLRAGPRLLQRDPHVHGADHGLGDGGRDARVHEGHVR